MRAARNSMIASTPIARNGQKTFMNGPSETKDRTVLALWGAGGSMKRVAVLAVLAMLACTTTQQSSAPSAAAPKSNYKNLQVLPKDISREQLLATMRSFTRGLGVRCNHCHVVKATEPKEELDFPSDAKDE